MARRRVPKGAPTRREVLGRRDGQGRRRSPQFKAYLKDNAASEAPIAGAAFEKFLANQERLYRDLLGK